MSPRALQRVTNMKSERHVRNVCLAQTDSTVHTVAMSSLKRSFVAALVLAVAATVPVTLDAAGAVQSRSTQPESAGRVSGIAREAKGSALQHYRARLRN